MNRVFLSYAHEDEASAKQIERALRENGLDPWLDDIRLRTGDELLAVIANALQEADYLAVLLSPAALTKSWVITERRMALSREIDHGCPKVLVLWLRDYIRGIDKAPEVPKQTILANMLRTAGPQTVETFHGGPRLRRGVGPKRGCGNDSGTAGQRP